MIKKMLIAIALLIIAIAAVIFIYRYQLIQYSAETIIRKVLPEYIKIDKIYFDFKNSRIVLGGFKLSNPRAFSHKDLLEVEEMTCKYRMKGKGLIDGLEIFEPVFNRAVLTIERLGDGRLNLVEMQNVLESGRTGGGQSPGPGQRPGLPAASQPSGRQAGQARPAETRGPDILGSKKLSDVIKLPDRFLLKDGKIIFIDRFSLSNPHMITFENIDAKLVLRLNDSYSALLDLSSTGQGVLNGNRDEVVRWVMAYNPTTPKLTMSNRFEVSNVDMMPFEPYYDRYSPLVFVKGRFSGTLIFDFDNGSIGSTNEIHLSDFRFYIKQGYENAQFWETTVPDLVKYFSSSFGEIVFDFKIKGDMSSPRFYLGPISKQAIASMAIEKISEAIQKMSGSPQGGGGPKSDIEKAKEYIDLFKGLLKK